MNILINAISRTIVLYRPASKKVEPIYKVFSFSYPLSSNQNKIKAIDLMLNSDVTSLLSNEQTNTLIIADDALFNGIVTLPSFSKGKTKDAFETKLKINFPNFQDYYVSYDEYERNQNSTLVCYTIANSKCIDELKDAFKHHNVLINNVDYFGNLVASKYGNQNNYPKVVVCVGDYETEVIVLKGQTVIGTSLIELGQKQLLDKSKLFDSTYNIDNEESLKYASFHKIHFDTKDLLTDEIINKSLIHESFKGTEPREARILKDSALENYHLKTNFKKYHSQIMDVVEYYTKAPYFLPVNQISVFATDEFFGNLLLANSDEHLKYKQEQDSLKNLLNEYIEDNPLFSSKLSNKVRRKIDWAKLLTMEIGKKKKA